MRTPGCWAEEGGPSNERSERHGSAGQRRDVAFGGDVDRPREEFRELEVSWQSDLAGVRLDHLGGVVGVVRSRDAHGRVRGGSRLVAEDVGTCWRSAAIRD